MENNKPISAEDALLSQFCKDNLEVKRDIRWTENDFAAIVAEAVRLVKKDDYFWEAIENAVDTAIENCTPEDDDEFDDDEEDNL